MNSSLKGLNLGVYAKVCVLVAAMLWVVFPTQVSAQRKKLKEMVVTLSQAGTVCSAQQCMLVFTVLNPNAKRKLKFCRYMTPIEGFNGNILNVTDPSGNPAKYLGVMKKRSGPTKEDYIKLAGGEKRVVEFDLAKAYDLSTPGNYQVSFKGNKNLNQLPDSESISILVQ